MVRLVGADYEHRRYDATVRFRPKARRHAPGEAIRRIAREMIAVAIVAQTGADRDEIDRLIREGVVRINRDVDRYSALGTVTVRLDKEATHV